VSHALATAGLFALAGAVFLLPLIPAIVELRLKRDAQALNVIQQYAGDIRHFSFGFRSYAAELLTPLQQCVDSGRTATGMLPHGDRFLLLGRPEPALLLPGGSSEKVCDLVVAAGTDLTLPDGMTFMKEMYASRELIGGANCTYRAILGDGNVRLDCASAVTRWVHAAGTFQAEQDCDLYGRISSDREIMLRDGCFFQRLHAPRIVFGRTDTAAEAQGRGPSDHFGGPGATSVAASRRLVDGDLEIGRGEVVTGSIVSRGQLHIGAGARILGSVKSNRRMTLESGISIAGSVVSASAMQIGFNCRIAGPVIAEQGIAIGSGTRCGTPERPTTVSAPTIEVEDGAVVFGTIWARQEGRVVPRQ